MGAAHAARGRRHRRLLGRDSRLLPAVPRPQCVDRRFPPCHGGCFATGSRLVLRSVAEAFHVAVVRGRLALQPDGQTDRGRAEPDAGGRSLPRAGGIRHHVGRRAGDANRTRGDDGEGKSLHDCGGHGTGGSRLRSEHVAADDRGDVSKASVTMDRRARCIASTGRRIRGLSNPQILKSPDPQILRSSDPQIFEAPDQKLTLNPTRTIRGARICCGTRYEPPTAEVNATTAAELLMLKKSTCGTIRRPCPNLNAREMRTSAVVTVGSRSSPRALRKTVWVPRVSGTTDATAARDAEYVEAYGPPPFASRPPAINTSPGNW